MILLSDICKDVSNVAYLGWRGLGKHGAWNPPQGAKSHIYISVRGIRFLFPEVTKFPLGACPSLEI